MYCSFIITKILIVMNWDGMRWKGMHCLMQYLWNLRDGDIDDYQDYGFDQLLLNDVSMSFNI